MINNELLDNQTDVETIRVEIAAASAVINRQLNDNIISSDCVAVSK